MKRSGAVIFLLCLFLTAGWINAQSQGQASVTEGITGSLPAKLVKPLDSKKVKPGDPVICETSIKLDDLNGRFIPSGTKIIGRITQAQARSKGDSASSLAMVFDKIELGKNDIPIKGVLQAVGPAYAYGPNVGPATMPGLHKGADIANQDQTLGHDGGIHAGAAGALKSDSKGVVGVKNLELGDKSVLFSTEKEIKLEAGTQIVVRAE